MYDGPPELSRRFASRDSNEVPRTHLKHETRVGVDDQRLSAIHNDAVLLYGPSAHQANRIAL